MRRAINFYMAVLFLVPATAFIGCGAEEEEAVEEIIPEDQLISTETEVKRDLVIGDIPSPSKLASEIPKAGVSYNKSLLNPSSKAGSYSTDYQKAMNLGIYVADLSYSAAYNQPQDATSYISTAKQLADGLGIAKAFDDNLLKSFEQNINKPDSLMRIIDVVYENADKFLRSNDRVKTAAFVLAGGWIEGLYLSTQMLGDSGRNGKNDILYQSIGEQKFSLKNLISLISEYQDSPDHAKLLEQLNALVAIYQNIPKPSKISSGQVRAIREKIVPMRNEITG